MYTEGFNSLSIRSDGIGYYAYLPSLFIFHDISLYSFLHDKQQVLAYNRMQANGSAIGAWETFKLVDMGDNKVALQASNGQYVCAERGGGHSVVANRNAAYAWETFKLLYLGNTNVALQAYNGQYVCAEGGGGRGVVANCNTVGDWGIFKLVDLGNNNVALRAHNGQYICSKNGGGIDKYPMGAAILIAPFFFAADLITVITSQPRDGFSLLYQIAVFMASIFYLLFGLVLTYRLLLQYYPKQTALVTLPLLTFGTGLFFYATYDPSFSHVYSFFLVAAYLYALYRPSHSLIGVAVLPAILLGLITLTRMPNIVLGIFLVFRELSFFWQEHPPTYQLTKRWTAMLIAFSVVASLQFAYYYIITGKFFIYSYEGEVFNWLNPQVLPVLFSVNKGLFFWYPILLLSVVGIPFLLHYAKHLLSPFVLFHLAYLYIISSWWCWWYGGCFGMRPYVDVVAVFALSFAAAIDHFSASRYRWMMWSLTIAAVIWYMLNRISITRLLRANLPISACKDH